MWDKKILFILASCSMSPLVLAQGIIINNEDIRADLNWLNQQGVIQISTSTWPLSGGEVQRVLSQAQPSTVTQQRVIDSIQKSLKADNDTLKLGAFAETDKNYLPQTFGDTSKSQYQANFEFNTGGSNWDAKLNVNVEKDQLDNNTDTVNIEGSYIAGKFWNQWLVAGQIPTWWGPGQDGSLIRGDASRPVYGFTLQRDLQDAFETKWLSWIGPWQYQAFAGQLKDYNAIPNTKLLGFRLTAQPLPYLEIGGSRILQWGGDGRSQSFDSLWNAIRGNDNFEDADQDESNQLAGLDFRLNLNSFIKAPISVYGQYVGEDEAGFLPSRKLYLMGADFSSNFKTMPYQIYAEWADTRTNGEVLSYTYNHRNYTDGFYQNGYPLAFPIGGDGEMYSLGGNIRIDVMNRLSGRVLYAKVNESNMPINSAFPYSDNIKGIDLTWTHYIKSNIPLKLKGWVTDSDIYGNDSGISAGIEVPLNIKF